MSLPIARDVAATNSCGCFIEALVLITSAWHLPPAKAAAAVPATSLPFLLLPPHGQYWHERCCTHVSVANSTEENKERETAATGCKNAGSLLLRKQMLRCLAAALQTCCM